MADIIVSLLILILTLPVFVLASVIIYLEDRGPIFYTQYRTGLKRKIILIRKLRTMRTNSEPEGAIWSKKNDPRISKVGKFLRLFRIDELPQLISVIKGDMSLIGPRPERPEIEVTLENEIPNYYLRYRVKPGLSGWSQVNYPYGASINDAKKKLSYDLYYIKNYSIWLDLIIFIKTIRVVFSAKGAIAK